MTAPAVPLSPRRPRAARVGSLRGLTVPALAVGAASISPVVYLLDRARSAGWSQFHAAVFRRATLEVLGRSVALTVIATLGCTIVGVAAAALAPRAGRGWWRSALALPLAIPTYVAAFAWVATFPGMKGLWGAALVLIACSYPYVYLPVVAALDGIDRSHEDVARSLGASPWRAFLTVTLPQVRSAVTSGALLAALYVLSDFGAVATMRYQAFTWEIFQSYRAGFNPTQAASLALVLVIAAGALVGAELRARGQTVAGAARRGARADHAPRGALARWIPRLVLTGVLGVAVAFPVVTVVSWTVTRAGDALAWGDLRAALGNSLRFSVLAAAVTTALAVVVALAVTRAVSRATRIAEAATYLTHALPAVVIGISMIYLSLRVAPAWYQRTPVLIAAYVLLFLPLAVSSSRAAIERCPLRFDEVSRSLGHGAWATTALVTLRVAAPGLAAGAALTALAAMKELPATLLLHPTGTDTLSMELWTAMGVSDYRAAAPFALALVLFAAVPTAVLGSLSGRFGAHHG